MLSRLPIVLDQLKAENDSENLENEIKELLEKSESSQNTKTIKLKFLL